MKRRKLLNEVVYHPSGLVKNIPWKVDTAMKSSAKSCCHVQQGEFVGWNAKLPFYHVPSFHTKACAHSLRRG